MTTRDALGALLGVGMVFGAVLVLVLLVIAVTT